MGQFEIVLILMVVLAAASINFGWHLGYNKRNNELTEEAVEEFLEMLKKYGV
jgi:hypothetical protein